MNEVKQTKLQRFVNDEAMMEAVFEVIQESFLKARPNKDVYYLAAKSLAVEFLDEAKRSLTQQRISGPQVKRELNQVGL